MYGQLGCQQVQSTGRRRVQSGSRRQHYVDYRQSRNERDDREVSYTSVHSRPFLCSSNRFKRHLHVGLERRNSLGGGIANFPKKIRSTLLISARQTLQARLYCRARRSTHENPPNVRCMSFRYQASSVSGFATAANSSKAFRPSRWAISATVAFRHRITTTCL
jgi:hypothetical protein